MIFYINVKEDTDDDDGYINTLTVGITDATSVDYYNGVGWVDTTTNIGDIDAWHKFTLLVNSTANKVTHAWYDDAALNIGSGTDAFNDFYGVYFYVIETGTYFDNITLSNLTAAASPWYELNTGLVNESPVASDLYANSTFNGTAHNGANMTANCYFYVNRNGDGWLLNHTYNGVNLTTNTEVGYYYGFLDGYVDMKINCSNSDGTAETGVYRHIVDSTSYFNYLQLISNYGVLTTLRSWSKMIWLVLLYMGFLAISIYLIKTGNSIMGFMMLLTSLGLDFLLTGEIYNNYSGVFVGSGTYAVFSALGSLWFVYMLIGSKVIMTVLLGFKSKWR